MEEEHPTLLILGVLLALRSLVPLLQQQVKDTSLKGSFGVTRKETEVSPSTEQLVQVGSPRAPLRRLCRQDPRSETRLLWKRSGSMERGGLRVWARAGPAGSGSRSWLQVLDRCVAWQWSKMKRFSRWLHKPLRNKSQPLGYFICGCSTWTPVEEHSLFLILRTMPLSHLKERAFS